MRFWVVFTSVLLVLVVSVASGQNLPIQIPATQDDSKNSTPKPSQEITADSIKNRSAEIAGNDALSPEEKQQAKSYLDTASASITERDRLLGDANAFRQSIDNRVEDLKTLQNDLKVIQEYKFDSRSVESMDLTQLEQELRKATENLSTQTARLTELDAEPRRRAARLEKIPDDIKSVKDEIAKVEKELEGLTKDTPVAMAQVLAVRSKRQELLAKLQLLENETEAYSALSEGLVVERDLVSTRLAKAKEITQQLQTLVAERRKQVVASQAADAKQAKKDARPELASLAEEIGKLTSKRSELADKIEKSRENLTSYKEILSETTIDFSRAQDKVKTIGLTHESGQLLRKRRSSLPVFRDLRKDLLDRNEELREVRFSQYEYQESLLALSDITKSAENLIVRLDLSPTDKSLQAEVEEFLKKKKEYLTGLTADYDTYTKLILQLNDTESQLIDVVSDYRNFINERVIWIKSAFQLSPWDWTPGVAAFKWMTSRRNWLNLLTDLQPKSVLGLMIDIFSGMIFVLLLVLRIPAKQLYRANLDASRRGFTKFLPTLKSLLLTLVLSVGWPFIYSVLGWKLGDGQFAFSRAVGSGLLNLAVLWFCFDFVRKTFREKGLAECHLEWKMPFLKTINLTLRFLIFFAAPVFFVSVVLAMQTTDSLWSNSLGRAMFLVFWLFVIVALFFVVWGKNGLIRWLSPLDLGSSRWLMRACGILLILIPVAISILAYIGYYETSQILTAKLFQSLFLVFVSLVGHGILKRWLLISRRRMALDRLRQRSQSQFKDETGSSPEKDAAETNELNLAEVSMQSARLLRSVVVFFSLLIAFWIWVDVVPAFRVLGEGAVWPGMIPIHWTDLFLAIAIVVLTYVAMANIPGFLEMTLLSLFSIDAGARYAVSTLCRYVIVALGVALTGNALGFTWSSIQWLVAAMGIGLGFGLQEIFANFISGLILLFERPIRVGDIITLGDTTGVVTRIRIRATTVTDWDRKEFVVPNKDLVTGRLLNWTLSDETTRLVIPIGIAYGSDTDLAMTTLLKIAGDNEHVLKEPPPIATFEAFGDSSLNLVLRCFLPNLENRLACLTELCGEIDREFKRLDIEIAFPQRDIHIRNMPLQGISDQNGSGKSKQSTPTTR